jgi:hypothetical protein
LRTVLQDYNLCAQICGKIIFQHDRAGRISWRTSVHPRG